jgi:hypothetical protein
MAIESEPLEAILTRRDWYLSENTGVNVWLGIKYFREEGTWWMGLCARHPIVDHASDEAHGGWDWMAQLPGLESGEAFPSVHDVRNEVWKVSISLLFHPISMEDVRPGLPYEITVEVDKYRDRIVRPDINVCALMDVTGEEHIEQSLTRVTYVGEDPDDDNLEDDPDYEEEDGEEDEDEETDDDEDMEEDGDEDEDEDLTHYAKESS